MRSCSFLHFSCQLVIQMPIGKAIKKLSRFLEARISNIKEHYNGKPTMFITVPLYLLFIFCSFLKSIKAQDLQFFIAEF